MSSEKGKSPPKPARKEDVRGASSLAALAAAAAIKDAVSAVEESSRRELINAAKDGRASYYINAKDQMDAFLNYRAEDAHSSLLKSLASREHLSGEIKELRNKIAEATAELDGAKRDGKKSEQKVEDLTRLVDELRVKEDLGFLLSRVGSSAQERLVSDEKFREVFSEERECRAFVMSVDIRRSTELMLKARSPSAFAEFISSLTRELYGCVVRNNGVFDKFTGDGVLAFFPEEFSGEDAGYAVMRASAECHEVFERIYKRSRSSFTSVLTGIGLGIGIDYGAVRLLRIEGLTVVGVPVVYACRLSSALPGQTLLNQPAYEVIGSKYGKLIATRETEIDIKHEGKILAYDARLEDDSFDAAAPSWMNEGVKP